MLKNEKAPDENEGKVNITHDNIIPHKSRKDCIINDFTLNDFIKSGISEKTTSQYIQEQYLETTFDGWQLYYPELFENKKSDYFTKRLKNPKGKNKYIRPKDETSRLFRPLGLTIECLLNPYEYVIFTEGEKKSIKAVQDGFNCISIGGVQNWRKKINLEGETEDENEWDIIPDMVNLKLTGKLVYICYDNDLWEKEPVKKALYALACYLIGEKKAKVKIIILPKGDAKGLDDYLMQEGKEAFQKILDEAKEITLKDIQDILSGNNEKVVFPIYSFNNNKVEKLLMDLHERLDAPLEYIASSFLAGTSLLMDGKYKIIVDKAKNWVEHPILWITIIGNPSQKKTPCLNLVKKIIDEFEKDLTEKYELENQKYKVDLINYKIDLKLYEKPRMKDATLSPPKAPEEPTRQIITSQSITVEALAKALSKNNGKSIAIFVDELASLLKGMGQYKGGGGNDLEYFLQAWKKQSYNVLRSNQENSFTVLASHNIIGSIQPKVLETTLFNNNFESSNGMIERWLYSCSDYEETGLKYTETEPYNVSLIKNIYVRLFNNNIEKQYHFDSEAQKLFDDFCYSIIQAKKDNISNLMKSYLQKQTDYVARFSLILHCINDDTNLEISVQAVKNAISLSCYYITCFEKISQQNCNSSPLASQALEYLRTKGLKSISPSMLHKSNMSKYKSSKEARAILEMLAGSGFGRFQKTKNGGCNFIFYS